MLSRPLLPEPLEARTVPSFFPAVPYDTGILPVAVAARDFNGDGFLDLVTASLDNPTQSVAVLLGNGDGSFQAALHSGVGVHLQSLAVDDFNGDGLLDVVTANFTRHLVSVLLGNGDGTFQRRVNYPTSPTPRSVAVADFDSDGALDLVTAHPGNVLNVLRGNGDGSFQDAVVVPLGPGTVPHAVVVGDVNGDGLADVVTANARSHSVSVLLGNGDGSFLDPVSYAVEEPRALVVVDINGDGLADLVTMSPGVVYVLLGNGDGSFQEPVQYSSGSGLSALAVADFDSDGFLDVATASSQLNVVTVLGADYAVGSSPFALAVGDVNADGFADLATANTGSHNVSVLLNAANWGGGALGAGLPTDLLNLAALPNPRGTTPTSALAAPPSEATGVGHFFTPDLGEDRWSALARTRPRAPVATEDPWDDAIREAFAAPSGD